MPSEPGFSGVGVSLVEHSLGGGEGATRRGWRSNSEGVSPSLRARHPPFCCSLPAKEKLLKSQQPNFSTLAFRVLSRFGPPYSPRVFAVLPGVVAARLGSEASPAGCPGLPADLWCQGGRATLEGQRLSQAEPAVHQGHPRGNQVRLFASTAAAASMTPFEDE